MLQRQACAPCLTRVGRQDADKILCTQKLRRLNRFSLPRISNHSKTSSPKPVKSEIDALEAQDPRSPRQISDPGSVINMTNMQITNPKTHLEPLQQEPCKPTHRVHVPDVGPEVPFFWDYFKANVDSIFGYMDPYPKAQDSPKA